MTSYALTLTDGPTLTDTLPNFLRGVCVMSEGGVYTDVLDGYSSIAVTLAETATHAATIAVSQAFAVLVSAGSTFSTASSGAKVILIPLAEGASLADVMTPNAILRLTAEESVGFAAILVIDGEQYVAWVANSDTFAHSRYEGFNFNSMCRLGDHYYGANDSGIFLLEGDTDDGEQIDFYATLPKTQFGTSKIKRIPKVYFGVTSTGDMRLKVVTRDGIERVYMIDRMGDGYSELGTAIGRGVKSRYWTFDLYNMNGGDAEIESIEFYPVVLSRLLNS